MSLVRASSPHPGQEGLHAWISPLSRCLLVISSEYGPLGSGTQTARQMNRSVSRYAYPSTCCCPTTRFTAVPIAAVLGATVATLGGWIGKKRWLKKFLLTVSIKSCLPLERPAP
jgi:hypothetical protein